VHADLTTALAVVIVSRVPHSLAPPFTGEPILRVGHFVFAPIKYALAPHPAICIETVRRGYLRSVAHGHAYCYPECAPEIAMPKKKKTAEEVADAITEIIAKHLDTLPAAEREKRIAAFEKRLATASPRAARSKSSLSGRTRPTPHYARGRG